MTMPAQKPGKSEQSVATPMDFQQAVYRLLGIPKGSSFYVDLAADETNACGLTFIDKESDSLTKPWAEVFNSLNDPRAWFWLNPPFAAIKPWVKKAYEESRKGAKIAVLVPLSTATWWTDWVDGKAQVYLLKGRLTFVGHKSAFPKDLALLLYRPDVTNGYSVWDWKS